MARVFLSKLLLPNVESYLVRKRLLPVGRPHVLLLQAPGGSGKTVFLSQWLGALNTPFVYYHLDDQDQAEEVFANHLLAGFRRCWTDWAPAPEAVADLTGLAAEIVNEAVGRPPVILALDRVDEAIGQAWLADFLTLLFRYAPPNFTLVLSTRAPLPGEVGAPGSQVHTLTAADLAMTRAEAEAWLGAGEWEECFTATEGFPLALRLWQQCGPGWRSALSTALLANLPKHVEPEVGRALVEEWLAGRLSLASFAHQFAQGEPGAERLWEEADAARQALLMGKVQSAIEMLRPVGETARGTGNRPLMGAVALLIGEAHYCLGEYSQAMEWYRQAFQADALLELVGCHSIVAILKDQGHLDEAEALALRCIEARQSRADYRALAYAHEQYAVVMAEQGRFDEAEKHLLEAERLGLKLSGEPFYGILALAQRGVLQALRGNPAEHRRLAQEAHALARGYSPWLEAISGFILAPALIAWGEVDEGRMLLEQAVRFLTEMDAKWQLHMVHANLARVFWSQGKHDEARREFDKALALGAKEGYVQYLRSPRAGALPLLIDALVRRAEAAYCQELLVRIGEEALPALLELTGQPAPGARRAALYPLAAIGGKRAEAAIRHLLYDEDETVRDGALMALKAMEKPAVAAPAPPSPATSLVSGARVKVAVLGPMQVYLDGSPVPGWRTQKARDLLAYLVVSGDRPVTRGQLLEALWPDAELEAAQALLHTSLYQLRRTLKPAGEVISYAGGAYRLLREACECDLDHFHKLAAAGTEEGWRAATDLYRGELLEGLDYEWAAGPRARARSTYLEALRNLAAHCQSGNRHGQAIHWLQLLVQADPLAEASHMALMECYAAIGNRNAAVQQYHTLAHLLDEELGLEPSAAARALYQRLLE